MALGVFWGRRIYMMGFSIHVSSRHDLSGAKLGVEVNGVGCMRTRRRGDLTGLKGPGGGMQQARAVRNRQTLAANPKETAMRLNGFVGRACEAAKVDDGRGWKQRPLLGGGEVGD